MTRQSDTRIRVVDALETLLKTHELENIRISNLCQLSGISRTTFYVYFEDIYAVVQWYWDDLCRHSLYRINADLTWEQGHMIMLQGLLKRCEFFKKLFSHKDYQSLFSYGYRKSLIIHIENIERLMGRSLTDQELFELDYTIRALSAMTSKWAEEGMEVPAEQICALFSRYIPAFTRIELSRS